ncbi:MULTISPECIES: TorF family putative porin [unclassified Pseudomonas]|uniref:TorF family putative porin n=1 Tax=unclassified Pseudomonas TaxID=196821 RepID=UPI0021C607C0|nr:MULTISPECIES: TorF family putative porin [unclassified Pseudomonas]MCU1735032.1 TorF family putative porin [Pseudomonas sp. 20P_3.2_Bac4]MCU1743507.1 TorF family putative porin [Pseudomonas sp. 20P_3.2_Bac5]
MNKLTLGGLAGALLGLSLSAQAIDLTPETLLDINVGLASDYRVGGFSLNQDDGPVLLTSATLVHKISGLYAGVFTANVDMGTQSNREWDYYVGIARPITENTRFSLSYVRYEYPGDSWINFGEWIGTLGYRNATVGFKYANDLRNPPARAAAAAQVDQLIGWGVLPANAAITERDGHRLISWAEYDFYLPWQTKLNVRFGHTSTPDEQAWRSASGKYRSDYNDWQLAVSKRAYGLEWKAAYIDTDLSEAECTNNFGKGGDCSATVVFSASKRF